MLRRGRTESMPQALFPCALAELDAQPPLREASPLKGSCVPCWLFFLLGWVFTLLFMNEASKLQRAASSRGADTIWHFSTSKPQAETQHHCRVRTQDLRFTDMAFASSLLCGSPEITSANPPPGGDPGHRHLLL